MNISLVSVPKAMNFPYGLTAIVKALYGYAISATGPISSQSQK